jgi:hypothetical protein
MTWHSLSVNILGPHQPIGVRISLNYAGVVQMLLWFVVSSSNE